MSDVTDRGSAPHPTRRRRRVVDAMTLTTALAATLLVPVAAAPSAQAAEQPVVRRSATISTLSGQPPEGMPRVTKVAVVQDVEARTVRATATWASAQPAGDPAAVYVFVGVASGGACTARLGLAVHADAKDGAAILLPSQTPVSQAVAVSGASATVTASGTAELWTTAYTCAYAATMAQGATYQQSPWYTLDVARRAAPVLDVVALAPRVGATVGKWKTVKVRVHNRGDANATKVVVRVKGKGVKVSSSKVSFGTIKPGAHVTKKIKVRIASTKVRTATLTATASGGHKDTAKQVVLPVKRTTTPKSLAGRLYWGADSSLDEAWQNRMVWFVDGRWAYTGIAQKGRPTCEAGKKDCVRYTYSPRTGKVKVGSRTGTVTSKSLRLPPRKGAPVDSYVPVSTPKAGTRLATKLVHQGSSGCGYGYGKTCYTYTWRLQFTKDGRFVERRKGLTSTTVGGSWFIGGSDDERGTYKILSKGRIQLKYANGKSEVKTFGILQDVREKPDAKNVGVVVRGTKYYP
ncbi:CARDB domain-containing protein [Sanguibacter massiliensis]|uniref:CARDB domain-containing protein n=1 Tax=Sanguibacter massiliensis TaxID=1973217 RepID=UPI00101AD4C7|nr:CARDB domain-containing protein [Sanguibacter massiliensis]